MRANRPATATPRVTPSFKLAAVATLAGLRDSRGDVPLEAFVPVRTAVPAPVTLPPAAKAVLEHVDGEVSLKDISVKASLALPSVIEAYLALVSRGIVSVAAATPVPARPPKPPCPPSGVHPRVVVPRLQRDSVTDELETGVSDVVGDHARVSVGQGTPKLRRDVAWDTLTPKEAWIVSVVDAGLDVQAILGVSPLEEEDTLSLLRSLIDSRVIAVGA